ACAPSLLPTSPDLLCVQVLVSCFFSSPSLSFRRKQSTSWICFAKRDLAPPTRVNVERRGPRTSSDPIQSAARSHRYMEDVHDVHNVLQGTHNLRYGLDVKAPTVRPRKRSGLCKRLPSWSNIRPTSSQTEHGGPPNPLSVT